MEEPQLNQRREAGKPGEIVVFVLSHAATCSECGDELGPGNLLRVEAHKPLCIDCADLGHLEFLQSGNAALTRRAGKHSTLKAIVLKWSRARKRYERQGTLVEQAAIEKAEQECAADAPERAARRAVEAVRRQAQDQQFVAAFADAIRQQFPACPPADSATIASHACEKHSGRVGRSAAAKELDAKAVRLAVIAHIRHVHTNYDQLLGTGWDRREARDYIAPKIDSVLRIWEGRR